MIFGWDFLHSELQVWVPTSLKQVAYSHPHCHSSWFTDEPYKPKLATKWNSGLHSMSRKQIVVGAIGRNISWFGRKSILTMKLTLGKVKRRENKNEKKTVPRFLLTLLSHCVEPSWNCFSSRLCNHMVISYIYQTSLSWFLFTSTITFPIWYKLWGFWD